MNYTSEESVMDEVSSGNLILVQEVTILQQQMVDDSTCNLALGQDLFYKSHFGFPVRKDFQFKDVINDK